MSESTVVKGKPLRPTEAELNHVTNSNHVKNPSDLSNDHDFLYAQSPSFSAKEFDEKTHAQEQYDLHRQNANEADSAAFYENRTDQNTGSAQSEPVPDLLDHLKSVWQESRSIIQSHIDLATIEAIHTVKKFLATLLTTVVITILATLMVCTAWISVVVACAFYLMEQGLDNSTSFFIITGVHLLIFAICYGITRYKLNKLAERKIAGN